MSFISSFPKVTSIAYLFNQFPETGEPVCAYTQELLRGPSPFTIAERELIAAFVSALNQCDFCHNTHMQTALAYGLDEELLSALLEDIDTAPIDSRLRPVLHYVKKLTQIPSRMVQADADAVFAAGWNEAALYHAVSVCGLFNFYNRLVEGIGIRLTPEDSESHARTTGQWLHDNGYLLEQLRTRLRN